MSFQHYDLGSYLPSGVGRTTLSSTTFFVAPSADYFVIDGLSLGALLEFSTTSSKAQVTPGAEITRPTTTSLAAIPRIGWLFAIGDRFAIWPRGGIGYVSRERLVGVLGSEATERFGSFVLDANVGLLYRFTEAFFVLMGPGLTMSLGGSRSITSGSTTVSADSSVVQFSVLGGFGAMVDLL